ncbi:MAG: aminotransferase class I/II-fold pyridoxal phosphate-dependent enzyme [Bacteroidota bacterium]|nr:aminotransferase class I/II-fold pyridoxal phosphate-dependent enzyme [Bacteroidota bacterium]
MHFDSLSAREWKDPRTTQPHILPIYATSSFDFEDIEHSMRVFANIEEGHTYSRYRNPTVDATAAKIAAMETFETGIEAGAIMTNSGMAAIDLLIGGLLQAGDKILTQATLYGGTTELLMKVVAKTGIEIIIGDLTNGKEIESILEKDPSIRLVYFETPANPTLACVDIEMITEITSRNQRWSAIDNTFASPYLQRPFKFGVDFVLHSTTKYLNGHGNGMAGIVIGKDVQLMNEKIWTQMKLTGVNCSPFEAWLVYQGLKTLPLRMHKHCSNALFLAYKLAEHPKVAFVNYPGLESHPDYMIARKQMDQSGGMLSFELKGNLEDAIRTMNNFKLCSLAPTLGDVDTLILHPASSSHIKVSPEIRKKAGISDSLIRVSVGIENPQDILEDFLQAIG